ncbi:MAG: preprotein translocase subunit SecE [Solobacterium sp.]|nr:preprotein translocase subunit SecE [Solobacterium sp.]
MDKTFTWSGVKKEAKRVRWPKRKDVTEDTIEVVSFTAFFAVYFVICEFVVTQILKLIGIGA